MAKINQDSSTNKIVQEENIPEQEHDKKVVTCGIVMPISPIEGYNLQHWTDVKHILEEIIRKAGFAPVMVNMNNEIGVIQKRIIQNLYNNEILVCDVSGKNLNVMFELGMRLAFDKPTIVIKDDETEYSFDIASLEHLSYPKDLRYNKIRKFERDLQVKLKTTYENAQKKGYSTFLQNFGTYKVKGLENKEIDSQEYIIKELKKISDSVKELKSNRIDPEIFAHYLPNIISTENILLIDDIRESISTGKLKLALDKLHTLNKKTINDLDIAHELTMVNRLNVLEPVNLTRSKIQTILNLLLSKIN